MGAGRPDTRQAAATTTATTTTTTPGEPAGQVDRTNHLKPGYLQGRHSAF
jgi:hypothetical protein